jgi:hypothetical protein
VIEMQPDLDVLAGLPAAERDLRIRRNRYRGVVKMFDAERLLPYGVDDGWKVVQSFSFAKVSPCRGTGLARSPAFHSEHGGWRPAGKRSRRSCAATEYSGSVGSTHSRSTGPTSHREPSQLVLDPKRAQPNLPAPFEDRRWGWFAPSPFRRNQ